jgi:selenocysteine lyase/cysteine desulfurase
MIAWIREQLVGHSAMIETPFGPRRLTYADYVASGRPLEYIETLLREQVMPFYANTHTEDSFTGRHTTHCAHDAATYIKRCLGADDRFKIVFAGSGSTGAIKRLQEMLGMSVPSCLRERLLGVLRPDERPVVFVGPYEHHSNEVSWRETIAEVVEIPLSPEGLINLAVLEQALQEPRFAGRPMIGSFSAASNVTGILSDTRAIARLLHAHGAWACFDFAASAPYVTIDMRPGEPDGYDAVFISPHKFIGGPGTPGILVFNSAMYRLNAPSTAGGGTVLYVSPTTHHFVNDIEAREDAGTPAILQKVRAGLVFWIKEQVGVETIEGCERSLITRAVARLRQHPRLELLGNLDVPRLAILSFLIRSGDDYLHPRFVVRLLNDLFGIQARGGCACAGPYGHTLLHIDSQRSTRYWESIQAGFEGVKPGWTRVNFNYFLSDVEFAFLLQAIEFVADYGERFLSLYDFDWHTGTWSHPADPPLPALFEQPLRACQPLVAEPALPGDDELAAIYQRYLDEARELASVLPSGADRPARDVPADVAPDLVFFRH